MKITICASLSFIDQIIEIQKKLEELGHTVFIPNKVTSVDCLYEGEINRLETKKKYEFIEEHMGKIEQSEAILVVNITKKEIENYIGANTFLEIGFAHYRNKKIYLLNSIPNQPYIIDELLAVEPTVIDGNVTII